jgi:hypothetical protein
MASHGLPHDGWYESPCGDEIDFYRCDGRVICGECGRSYSDHPADPREECLTVICGQGRRVKL